MSQFKVEEPMFPTKSWDERMVGEMGEWLEWVAQQAEDAGKFPSWTNMQGNFLLNFPDEKSAPSDKVLKRLLIKTLRDSGRGEWIK